MTMWWNAVICGMLVVVSVHGLSTGMVSSPSSSSPTKSNVLGLSSVPNVFLASVQRNNLKRDLIRAAQRKEEGKILALVDQLALLNPTECPTAGLMGYEGTTTTTTTTNKKAPLNGKWRLLFTNARDAEAPARTVKNQSKEPFGDSVANGIQVKTGQRIDAARGECINYIQLGSSSSSSSSSGRAALETTTTKLPFDRLDITIRMTALSDTRVRLDFLKGRVQNPNAFLPTLRDFQFQFPPAALGDFLARLRGKDPMVEPPAYFDILYIDNDLRVHRTGEGKVFVQQRDGN